jgi:hypothetical protein
VNLLTIGVKSSTNIQTSACDGSLGRPALSQMRSRCAQIGRIVARRAGAKATNGEAWIERKPGLCRGPRFIDPAEIRQGRGEIELPAGEISVKLKGAAKPYDGLLIAAQMELSEARHTDPLISVPVDRTDAERLLDMRLGFLAATDEVLSLAGAPVRTGQISIQFQRSLAFGDALHRPLEKHLDEAQLIVRPGMSGT